ncbi:MAG: DUF1016 domain-containing protein [Spirulina sp. SIO3F2]|nr:DUF1016 domain-containing protein [Spirulina sp. SIO3F2]
MTPISQRLKSGQIQAAKRLNTTILETYWRIGRDIVEFEQAGQFRAADGAELLKQLSKDLKQLHSKGFRRCNISDMRQFY